MVADSNEYVLQWHGDEPVGERLSLSVADHRSKEKIKVGRLRSPACPDNDAIKTPADSLGTSVRAAPVLSAFGGNYSCLSHATCF